MASTGDLYDIRVDNMLHLMPITFLNWDHLLTFDAEVLLFWNQKISPSSILFFFNRYFAFATNISVLAFAFSNLNSKSCKAYYLYRQILVFVTQVIVCILLSIRIYALFERSRRVLSLLICAGLALIGAACSTLVGQSSSPTLEPGLGCDVALSLATSKRLAVAWEALFVYDSIIFSLTVYKTYRTRQAHQFAGGTKTLLLLILRDGAVYFAVMAISNLANILTFYLLGPYLRGGLSTFSSCLSVTLMSRLMLNLRKMATTDSIFETHIFTSVLLGDLVDINPSYELHSMRFAPNVRNDDSEAVIAPIQAGTS